MCELWRCPYAEEYYEGERVKCEDCHHWIPEEIVKGFFENTMWEGEQENE